MRTTNKHRASGKRRLPGIVTLGPEEEEEEEEEGRKGHRIMAAP